MTTTAAVLLIIIWPGHDIAPQSYPSRAVCEQTLATLRHAGHDLFEEVPGFKARCEADGPAFMS